jgi:hypothetical protein
LDTTLASEEIAARIAAAGDHPKNYKLRQQWSRALAFVGAHPPEAGSFSFRAHASAPPEPNCDFERIRNFCRLGNRGPEVLNWYAYLAARSKFTVHNRTPAGMLHKLYRPGEHVIVFNVFASQGCAVWTHPGLSGDLSTLNWLCTGQPDGVWFLNQPVDGEVHYNPRQGHDSRRSEESVTAWRFFLIESDCVPWPYWLRVLVQLPLPIASVTMSGGDSVHALGMAEADSKEEFDEVVRGQLSGPLSKLGADDDALTALRLTRLGNCFRTDKNGWQRLLYLNDEPAPCPIADLPPKRDENQAVWTRERTPDFIN